MCSLSSCSVIRLWLLPLRSQTVFALPVVSLWRFSYFPCCLDRDAAWSCGLSNSYSSIIIRDFFGMPCDFWNFLCLFHIGRVRGLLPKRKPSSAKPIG